MDNLFFEEKKDLFSLLSIKTSIIAEKFLVAKTREELFLAKRYSLEKKIPLFILGGGTNVVAISNRFSGLVVKNEYKEFKVVNEDKNKTVILVSSGYPVSLLVKNTTELGLKGFEYFSGLPGTVGGALYMNSKWMNPKAYFGDNLIYAYLIDNKGKLKKVDKGYFNFSYDYSILQKTKEIVLEAYFSLKKSKKDNLFQVMNKVIHYRINTQPKEGFTSGCFFRNISKRDQKRLNLPSSSAGYLIDMAGLKGLKVGEFYISEIHANFIINQGRGKKEDLKKLISIIKDKIKEKFGIELKEEVVVI